MWLKTFLVNVTAYCNVDIDCACVYVVLIIKYYRMHEKPLAALETAQQTFTRPLKASHAYGNILLSILRIHKHNLSCNFISQSQNFEEGFKFENTRFNLLFFDRTRGLCGPGRD